MFYTPILLHSLSKVIGNYHRIFIHEQPNMSTFNAEFIDPSQFRLGEPYIVNIRELFLARQYILQYAAFIYRNDCNMRVAHIAIYCIFKYFAIYCQYIAIYCILQQYIVYCDNIQNVATIFSVSRQYIAIYRNTSRIHRDVV